MRFSPAGLMPSASTYSATHSLYISLIHSFIVKTRFHAAIMKVSGRVSSQSLRGVFHPVRVINHFLRNLSNPFIVRNRRTVMTHTRICCQYMGPSVHVY